MGIRIDSDLIEQFQVAQRAVQFAGKHRLKVDGLLGSVLKTDTKRVRRYDFERPDPMNGVLYKVPISSSMGVGLRPACKLCQSLANSA